MSIPNFLQLGPGSAENLPW